MGLVAWTAVEAGREAANEEKASLALCSAARALSDVPIRRRPAVHRAVRREVLRARCWTAEAQELISVRPVTLYLNVPVDKRGFYARLCVHGWFKVTRLVDEAKCKIHMDKFPACANCNCLWKLRF